MTPKRVVWIAIVILALLVSSAAVVAILVGTESGTRWLLARAERFLPAQLDTGTVTGSLLRGVETRNLSWTDDGAVVTVRELRFSVRLRPLFSRRVEIDALHANGIDVTLIERETPARSDEPFAVDLPLTIVSEAASISGISVTRADATYVIERIALVGSLAGSELTLADFAMHSDWLSLAIAGRAELATPYTADMHVDWRWSGTDAPEFAGALDFSGDQNAYSVAHALRAPVEVGTEGDVSVADGKLRVDLTNSWRDLALEARGLSAKSTGGMLRVAGAPERYSLSIDTALAVDEWPAGRVTLEGEGDLESLRLAGVALETEAGRLQANGDVRWSPEPAWQLRFDAAELDPAVVTDTLAGSLDARGRSAGAIRPSGPEFDLAIERMAGSLNDYPVDGELTLSGAPDRLMLEYAALTVGGNHVVAAGRLREELDLAVQLRMPRVDNIIADAAGSLEGDVRVRGAPGSLSVEGAVSAASLAWREYAAGSVTARGRLAQAGAVDATVDASALRLKGNVVDSVTASIAGTSDAHRLRARIQAPGNEISIDAGGGLADRSWRGRIDALSFTSDVVGGWDLERSAALELEPASIRLAEACFATAASQGRACGAIAYAADAPLDFDVALTALPLTALPLPLPAGVDIAGAVELRAKGQINERILDGTATLEVTEARFSTEYEGETISAALEDAVVNANVARNRLDAELRLSLSDEYGDIRGLVNVADVFDRDSALAGSASLDIDELSIFPILLPSVSNATGRIEGSVRLDGTVSKPQVLGTVALRNGALAVRRAGIQVSDIDMELRQLEPGSIGVTGRARSGDGRIAIDGSSEIIAATDFRARLDVTGENFEMIRLPDWRVAASPTISLAMDNERTVASGAIVIPTADITIASLPETAAQTSPDTVVHREDVVEQVRGRRIDVDVDATLGDAVRVSAFGLTTALEGGVNIRGGTHAPYIGSGRVRLREGRYKAYGQELSIERGELIFNGPLTNPNLDVRAVRPARNVVAGVHLTGTPRQLSSTVFSEPPLSEAETLSYLLTGRPLSSATAGEGEMLNKAAFALGLSQAGAIASQIGNTVGLDTLAVEGSAEESRLVAGKQVGERLFIEYGYGLINNLGRLLFRYQLNERVVVESTSGVVNTVDVVYSRKKD